VLPRSSTASQAEAEQRWAQTQTIEQHQLQLIALRTDATRIPSSEVLARQAWGKSGIFQGASYCALNLSTRDLKLLILLVAGACNVSNLLVVPFSRSLAA
jgi:hypothetical protein